VKTIALLLFALLVLPACQPQTPPVPGSFPPNGEATQPRPVKVTLRRAKNPRFLEIEIKNIGTQPFNFLDVAEGCACCDRFWEVEVRSASGKPLKPMMLYAPLGLPSRASIKPGDTYIREIQPGAYVDSYHPRSGEQGTIIVHYRVKSPDKWKGLLAPPYPTFSTQPLKVRLNEFLD
jgi:hypothetical protein